MATANNYVKDDSGATFIPATQRPDGTWRKARRVKDGYVPQEEMPLYESKGKQWAKNQPTLPPGLHPEDAARAIARQKHKTGDCKLTSVSLSGLDCANTFTHINVTANNFQSLSKAAKKNAKRKEKKKQKQMQDDNNDDTVDSLSNSIKNVSISPKVINVSKKPNNEREEIIKSTIDATKRLRNLKKKLRDISLLKQKIESGQLTNPEKDQLEKIERKKEIEAEVEELELLVKEDDNKA